MAVFYGQVSGKSETTASRQGSMNSGIKASVQSWNGSVITSLRYNEKDELIVNIYIDDGSAFEGNRYFTGTLEELKKKLKGGD